MKYEVKIHSNIVEVTRSRFRAWSGERYVNGRRFYGRRFYFGTATRYTGPAAD